MQLYNGVVTNCWIVNNTGDGWGGGVDMFGGTVVDCVVSSNAVTGAGAAWTCGGGVHMLGGSVINCTITHNWSAGAGNGNGNGSPGGAGGVALTAGLLRNCLIANNRATLPTSGHGGGVVQAAGIMENCTIASNTIPSDCYGGGVYRTAGVATNCVVFGNKKGNTDDNISGTNGFRYSCSPDLATDAATHNFGADPLFVSLETGNYRLGAGSPAIDTGLDLANVPRDLDGVTRPLDGNGDVTAVADMGCYEAPDATSGVLRCSFSAPTNTGLLSLDAVFTASVAGADRTVTWYGWDFDNDGTFDQSGPGLGTAANPYGVGVYSVLLTVSNASGEGASKLRPSYIQVYPSVYYVATNGGHVAPYDTWDKAGTNLQAVHDYAYAPGTTGILVRVTNGTYNLAAKFSIGKALTVRSENGPAVTILRHPSDFAVNMNNAQAVLNGFSLKNGYRGVELYNGLVTNCWIVNNTGDGWGGGVWMSGGRVARCVITNNAVIGSGPAWTCGGGAYLLGGSMHDCLVAYNTCNGAGGGNDSGVLGAGAGLALRNGWIRNCLIANNRSTHPTAGQGAGVYQRDAVVESCTIASNVSPSGCAGAGVMKTSGAMTNTIVWQNMAGAAADNLSGVANVFYSDAPELTGGVNGNLAVDPRFRNVAGGDFRLAPGSPCANAARILPWMIGGRDLDGRNRIIAGGGDMGCYESVASGTLCIIH